MAGRTTSYHILLIDDDPYEINFVERALALSTKDEVKVTQITEFRRAVGLVCEIPYDFILLDNRLNHRMSADYTVPVLNRVREDIPLAVLTHDTTPAYLACAKTLGVDYILDKMDLIKVLRNIFSGKVVTCTCASCEGGISTRSETSAYLRAVG